MIRGAGTAEGINEINNAARDILVSPASEVALRGVNDIHAITSTVQIGEDDATFNVLARPSTDMVPGRVKGTDAGQVSTFVDPLQVVQRQSLLSFQREQFQVSLLITLVH